jgi:hypothetical protein
MKAVLCVVLFCFFALCFFCGLVVIYFWIKGWIARVKNEANKQNYKA